AVGRRRSGEGVVRAGEIAPVVPPVARRHSRRHPTVQDLRRPRLLTDPHHITAALARAARDHGFDSVGVAAPDAAPLARGRVAQFVAEGAHGDMDWLADSRRGDPHALWSAARAVVMLGLNYGPDRDPLAILDHRDRGAISVYAQGDDYHDVVKKRLKSLARWLNETAGGEGKELVGTAAV